MLVHKIRGGSHSPMHMHSSKHCAHHVCVDFVDLGGAVRAGRMLRFVLQLELQATFVCIRLDAPLPSQTGQRVVPYVSTQGGADDGAGETRELLGQVLRHDEPADFIPEHRQRLVVGRPQHALVHQAPRQAAGGQGVRQGQAGVEGMQLCGHHVPDGEMSQAYLQLLRKEINDTDDNLKLTASEVVGVEWTAKEKRDFFRALERCGRRDILRIAQRVRTKSVVQVQEYLHHLHYAAQACPKSVVYEELPAAAELSGQWIDVEEQASMSLGVAAEFEDLRQLEKRGWDVVKYDYHKQAIDWKWRCMDMAKAREGRFGNEEARQGREKQEEGQCGNGCMIRGTEVSEPEEGRDPNRGLRSDNESRSDEGDEHESREESMHSDGHSDTAASAVNSSDGSCHADDGASTRPAKHMDLTLVPSAPDAMNALLNTNRIIKMLTVYFHQKSKDKLGEVCLTANALEFMHNLVCQLTRRTVHLALYLTLSSRSPAEPRNEEVTPARVYAALKLLGVGEDDTDEEEEEEEEEEGVVMDVKPKERKQEYGQSDRSAPRDSSPLNDSLASPVTSQREEDVHGVASDHTHSGSDEASASSPNEQDDESDASDWTLWDMEDAYYEYLDMKHDRQTEQQMWDMGLQERFPGSPPPPAHLPPTPPPPPRAKKRLHEETLYTSLPRIWERPATPARSTKHKRSMESGEHV